MMTAEIERKTVFSPDRVYRYTLWRQWADDLFHNKTKEGYVMFIGLNPSTADETLDDPTIRKCIGFTKRWGYLAICMTNLFAFRSTDPQVMLSAQNPVGVANNGWLISIAENAALVVCAWGTNGEFIAQDTRVIGMLRFKGLKCLRKTKHGHPEHPLYVPYETALIDFP